MPLTIDREISYCKQIPVVGHFVANGLQRIQDAVNQLGIHTGSDPTGTLPAPDPIQQLQVKASNGLVHAVITDSTPGSTKPLNYFMEYDTDPSFSQPHVIANGPSRSIPPFNLPAMNDSSVVTPWHFRAYSQLPGSHPGQKVNFGSPSAPTPVHVGGTQAMTLLPSTGSGTATGQQGGSGFGKVLVRGKNGN